MYGFLIGILKRGMILSIYYNSNICSINDLISIICMPTQMTDHLEFDGVVGITQCPISPSDTFTYAWQVNETPGERVERVERVSIDINTFPLLSHTNMFISIVFASFSVDI